MIGEDGHRAVGLGALQVAADVAGGDEPPLEVARVPVDPARRFAEDGGAVLSRPTMQPVLAQVAEDEMVAHPHGALGKAEAAGDLLDLGIGREYRPELFGLDDEIAFSHGPASMKGLEAREP